MGFAPNMSGSEFPRLNLVEACEYNIARRLHVVVRQKKKEKQNDRTRPLHQKNKIKKAEQTPTKRQLFLYNGILVFVCMFFENLISV